jgi:RNA-binding protein YlmH
MSLVPSLPPAPWTLFGGAEGCERQMLRFGSEDLCGYDQPFPIVILRLTPLSAKFAEPLTHRDYLGALLHLGIDRNLTGDIFVRDHLAWVFCLETARDWLTSLTNVRHTAVRVVPAPAITELPAPRLSPVALNIASERLDAVVAAFAGISRTQAASLFAAEKVFVNSRPVTDKSHPLKPGDLLSVRGVGKARYEGILRETRKGRLAVLLQKYT